MAEHNVGHDLMVIGNGTVPRPEEDRLTLAEKSERLNQQLKVRINRMELGIIYFFFRLYMYSVSHQNGTNLFLSVTCKIVKSQQILMVFTVRFQNEWHW